MKCKAAIVHGVGQDWSVEEIEVDPPKAGEVLVKWTHAGLCHSDEHLLTGDFVPPPDLRKAKRLAVEPFCAFQVDNG